MRRLFAGSAVTLVVVMGCTSAAWAQEAPAPPVEPTPPAASEPAPPPPAPPSEPGIQWSLDARAGLPVLKEGDTRLVADLAAGLRGKRFGIDVRGSAGAVDFVGANGSLVQTDRYEGGLDGFARFGTPALATELRFAGGAAYYGTTTYTPGSPFFDDDSILGRGSLLLGVRGETPSITYGLIIGGGLQVERRDTTTVSNVGATANDDSTTVKGRGELRARLRVPFWSDRLAVRFIEDAQLFTLTRDASVLTVSSGGVPMQAGTSLSSRQIESRTRLALDLTALSFGPLMPTAFVGLDVVSQSSDVGDATAIVPLGGLGLVHPDEKK